MGRKRAKEEANVRLENLINLIADLKEPQALAVLEKLNAEGVPPAILLDSCMKGMRKVGDRFEKGRYFIAALIMAGEIMRLATEMLGPRLSEDENAKKKGRVLLGTVQGDIHDLGKNLFASLLDFNGVAVDDLGVDVAPEKFVAKAKEQMPDVVGLSCVLTSCISSLEHTIKLLHDAFGDICPPVIIGGACVDEQIRKFTKADYWASDVSQGMRIYHNIFGSTS